MRPGAGAMAAVDRPGWRRLQAGADAFEAFMAWPAGPPVGAVLLVHPWWGANAFITRLAERLMIRSQCEVP